MISFREQERITRKALESLGTFYYRARMFELFRFIYYGMFKTKNPRTLPLMLRTAGIVSHDRILTGRKSYDDKLDESGGNA